MYGEMFSGTLAKNDICPVKDRSDNRFLSVVAMYLCDNLFSLYAN